MFWNLRQQIFKIIKGLQIIGFCGFCNTVNDCGTGSSVERIDHFPVLTVMCLRTYRKNWLFCDTPNGAQASAIVYTMVEMAKANGVNVYHYLTYLLEKLPDDRMSDDELELLAPWNETVKAEIERRANESNQSYVNCQGAPATEK